MIPTLGWPLPSSSPPVMADAARAVPATRAVLRPTTAKARRRFIQSPIRGSEPRGRHTTDRSQSVRAVACPPVPFNLTDPAIGRRAAASELGADQRADGVVDRHG